MLFAADFNYVLKLIWDKRMIYHAEDHKVLVNDNHGCRPGRQCIDPLPEKMLTYEITRLARTSCVTVDNDAKSCYDRILKTLGMIAWL